jgi:predicted ATP-binding protein involved in virulence
MKLQRLTLANFRGFEQMELDFSSDVTVIAGVNGVGKSGILSALADVASLALPVFTDSVETPLGLSDTDVQAGKSGLSLSGTISLGIADVYIDIVRAAPLEYEKARTLLKRRDDLRFAARETKKGSKEEIAINDDIRLIELQLAVESDLPSVRILPKNPEITAEEISSKIKASSSQPFAVHYSTARFFSRLPPILPKTKSLEIAAAYDKALNQLEVSLNDFANWYRVIFERDQSELANRLIQQLETAVNGFLPEVSDLQLHAERPPRFSVKKNGSRLFLEQLSDGERGLLALVFDLTRRLAIANPTSENPLAEGVALVLIDEIELHLHPKWQRQVLRLLISIFKGCQFVVTTHSPQVIGQARPEQLRLIHHNEAGKVILTRISQSFGMDSNWILQNIMGVPVRDYETEQRLSLIYSAIDENRLEDARQQVENMRSEIGDFPDLQEAIALLDRFDLLRRA